MKAASWIPSLGGARSRAALCVLVATLAGGAARIGTADWGLPYNLHVDEKGFVVWQAAYTEWRGLTRNDWRPRISTYGPLVFELAMATKWAVFGGIERARQVAQRYPNESAYLRGAFDHTGQAPFLWPRWFYALRLLSACAGTVLIVLLAAAAWSLAGPRAGSWTAVLAAASVGLIQVGHFYTAESLLVAEIAMLLHACALLARGGRWGASLYAGVSLALIASTKMTGLVVAVAVPVAMAAHDPFWRSSSRDQELGRMIRKTFGALFSGRMLLVLSGAAATLALVHPWLMTDPTNYFAGATKNRQGFQVLLQHLLEREFGFYDWRFTYNDTLPFVYYATHVLPYALGGACVAAAGGALVRGIWRREAVDRIAWAAALPTLVLIGFWSVKTIRYALPMVPPLVLIAGVELSRWAQTSRAPSAGSRRFRFPRLSQVAAWAVAGWTVAYGLAFTAMFLRPDPRVLAGRWLVAHAQPGDVVVLGPEPHYTALLPFNEQDIGVEPHLSFPNLQVRYLWRERPPDQAMGAYLRAKLSDADYLVVGEFYTRRGTHPSASLRAPAHHRFYTALRNGELGFLPVKEFSRTPRLGPLAWPEEDAEVLATSFDHMDVTVYRRVERFHNPFAALPW